VSEAVFIDARRPASARIGNLDFADCERIRHNRDAAFDGVIFIAVLTTGIYCRPVCPVRQPLSKNVRYYPSAAAAEADAFSPLPPLPAGNSPVLPGLERHAGDGQSSGEADRRRCARRGRRR